MDLAAGASYTIWTSDLGDLPVGAPRPAGTRPKGIQPYYADTTMTLYDTDGAKVLAQDDDSGPVALASRINFHATAAGRYYVKIQAYDATATGKYSIQATPSGIGEPDGTWQTAQFLPTDGKLLNRALETADDQDWFYTDLQQGHRYLIATSGLGPLTVRAQGIGVAAMDTFLALYSDPAAAPVATNDDASGTTKAAAITFDCPLAGRYYVRVTAYNAQEAGVYSISCTDQALPPALAWVGGTGYTADGVEPDSALKGSTFTFRVRYSHAGGKAPAWVRLRLWDPSGTQRSGSPLTMTSDGATTFETGVIYTVRVPLSQAGLWSYRFETSQDSVQTSLPATGTQPGTPGAHHAHSGLDQVSRSERRRRGPRPGTGRLQLRFPRQVHRRGRRFAHLGAACASGMTRGSRSPAVPSRCNS